MPGLDTHNYILWLALPLKKTFLELEQECEAIYYQTEEKRGTKRHLHMKVNLLKNKTKQKTLEFTGSEKDVLFTKS